MKLTPAQKTKVATRTNELICLLIMCLAALVVAFLHGLAMKHVPMEFLPRLISGLVALVAWAMICIVAIIGVCGNLSANWKRWIKG